MIYIKSYENLFLKEKYNVGDYIFIDTSNTRVPVKKLSKISYYNENNKMYGVNGIVNNKLENDTWWIFKNDIIRKLTPDEIKKVEIELNSEKFNL